MSCFYCALCGNLIDGDETEYEEYEEELACLSCIGDKEEEDRKENERSLEKYTHGNLLGTGD